MKLLKVIVILGIEIQQCKKKYDFKIVVYKGILDKYNIIIGINIFNRLYNKISIINNSIYKEWLVI